MKKQRITKILILVNLIWLGVYDVYMSKIKSGYLKNSADQSNADQPCKDTQTEDICYNEGENQCPEDFNKTFF